MLESRSFRATSPRDKASNSSEGEVALTLSPLGLSAMRLAEMLASDPSREMTEPDLIKKHRLLFVVYSLIFLFNERFAFFQFDVWREGGQT